MNKSYAVIFSYSFDNDVAVYLFETYEKAFEFMKDNYECQLREDEEMGWITNGDINEDEGWATIYNIFNDRMDVTEMKIGYVYE